MNKAKARDFFSDYYEGTLDAGLKQVFERALASDSSLKEDYEGFVVLMKDMDRLAEVEVPEPAFLSERIAGRIEAGLGAQNSEGRKASWWLSWGRWTFAGAAVLALVSIFVTSSSQPGSFTSGLIPIFGAKKTEIPGKVIVKNGVVRIQAVAPDFMLVTVRRAKSGEVVDRMKVDAWQTLNAPLKNSGPSAEVVLVEFSNGRPSIRLALPGSSRKQPGKGAGTVDDLANALADVYRLPVQIGSPTPTMPVSWEFGTGGPVGAVVSSADGPSLTIEERTGRLFID